MSDVDPIDELIAGGPLGLPGERFPFRPRRDHPEDASIIKRDTDRVLQCVDKMLYANVLRVPNGHQLREYQIDEMVQDCRVWLWMHVLPRYDLKRRVKLRTFIHCCVRNFVVDQLRKASTKGRIRLVFDGARAINTHEADDEGMDLYVELTAQAVLANPERFFSPTQVKIINALLENQNGAREEMRVLSRQLGYAHPSSLSNMLVRIKERVRNINMEAVMERINGKSHLAGTGQIADFVFPSQHPAYQRIRPRRAKGNSQPADEACAADFQEVHTAQSEADGQPTTVSGVQEPGGSSEGHAKPTEAREDHAQ